MSYRLIWADEFDYQGSPNPDKWKNDIGGHGFGNKEEQYYVSNLKNCYVADGCLTIKAFKEDKENKKYTSAKLTTYNKMTCRYGRIAVKAQLPSGKGTWPAIWMLGVDIKDKGRWPLCGEIDIMEHVGKKQDYIVHSLHSASYNHVLNNHRTHEIYVSGVSERFIEYAIDWYSDRIDFFVDGEKVTTFRKGERSDDDKKAGWPFNKPFFLILNLALGGTWGGPIDDAIFPVVMKVKYVRVYDIIGD